MEWHAWHQPTCDTRLSGGAENCDAEAEQHVHAVQTSFGCRLYSTGSLLPDKFGPVLGIISLSS